MFHFCAQLVLFNKMYAAWYFIKRRLYVTTGIPLFELQFCMCAHGSDGSHVIVYESV